MCATVFYPLAGVAAVICVRLLLYCLQVQQLSSVFSCPAEVASAVICVLSGRRDSGCRLYSLGRQQEQQLASVRLHEQRMASVFSFSASEITAIIYGLCPAAGVAASSVICVLLSSRRISSCHLCSILRRSSRCPLCSTVLLAGLVAVICALLSGIRSSMSSMISCPAAGIAAAICILRPASRLCICHLYSPVRRQEQQLSSVFSCPAAGIAAVICVLSGSMNTVVSAFCASYPCAPIRPPMTADICPAKVKVMNPKESAAPLPPPHPGAGSGIEAGYATPPP